MNSILKRFHSFTHGIQLIFGFCFLKPYQLTQSLSNFYTSQSSKRTNTRKKERPEFEIMLEDIKQLTGDIKNRKKEQYNKNNPIHIVELGCGDGRFAQYLDEKLRVPFTYIGIDAASGLIQTAKERGFANNVQFFVGDMSLYLAALEQQSVDIIISMASIQHLHKSFRQSLWNNCYRVLNYNGLHITANRSYSKWMFTKHRKAMIIGFFLRIFNHATFGRSDYMIPFKTPLSSEKPKAKSEKLFNIDFLRTKKPKSKVIQNSEFLIPNSVKTDYRFYHLYLLGELLEYAHTAGFIVTKSGYISSDGVFNQGWKTSRNTYVVAKKDVGI